MSVQTEIDRIITAVEAAHVKVAEKGGTTARPYLVANLESAIDSIPEATDPVLQEKTVSPSTSSQSVTPDSGYDGLSKVTVNAMPTATQATPSISVSSGGLITASATQTAGYVSAGTKSATKQLTVQAAQTITPGTANKTIASGRYLTGTQTIKGDSNLVAANIAEGVSIFGVTGTFAGGEDITAETAEYTAQLDELESTIDSLPDAGSGGGSGGIVNTCNLRVSAEGMDNIVVKATELFYVTIDANGKLTTLFTCPLLEGQIEGTYLDFDYTIPNVAGGQMFCWYVDNYEGTAQPETNGVEYIGSDNWDRMHVFFIPSTATGTVSVKWKPYE